MSDTRNRSELPSVADILRSIALVPIGISISATICPGFLLCVPALAFVGFLAIVLVAAVTVLFVLVGAILATPFVLVLLVRSVRRLRWRHAVATHEPVSVTGVASSANRPPLQDAMPAQIASSPPVASISTAMP
jgi:hypothetical protein